MDIYKDEHEMVDCPNYEADFIQFDSYHLHMNNNVGAWSRKNMVRPNQSVRQINGFSYVSM